MTPLADEPVQSSQANPDPLLAGRRMRTFARAVHCVAPYMREGDPVKLHRLYAAGSHLLADFDHRPTYGEALKHVEADPALREVFTRLPLRQGGATATQLASLSDLIDQHAKAPQMSNPELPGALQDLAEEIAVDLHEACAAFADPDVFYPGVDDGIEPVSDAHVALVIAAMQRELGRELRDLAGRMMNPRLPAAPLALLPWRVQRALAERRRLRYAQWGIGQAEWESGHWSLWNVLEDADWLPRQVTDGRTAFAV